MRQPLRYQIMIPMLGLILAALAGVSVFNAYLAAGRAKRQIERKLVEISRTLDESTFPLTDSVLRQMRGLSGAEFVLIAPSGEVLASSVDRSTLKTLPAHEDSAIVLRHRVTVGGTTYFHAVERLKRQSSLAPPAELHILFPEAGYREARWDAIGPPLAFGLVAGVTVVVLAIAVAARVSRPITSLQVQVARIARGNFDPLPLPAKQDELRDLAQAVNRMAAMLSQYEREIRKTERLRTLAQLGGGIAHQLRNAATGCRMAIDLLSVERSLPADCESLVVARRQLELMERYLQQFLAVGRPARDIPHEAVDLGELVDGILPLVRPAAHHAGVELRWQRPGAPVVISGNRDELEQLVINLLLNAVEATARIGAEPNRTRSVQVAVLRTSPGQVELEVRDSGPGPRPEIRERIFDPFVSDKVEGVGLGLAVVRQVVEQHGGRIDWDRDAGMTRFRIEFSSWQSEPSCDELIGR